MKISAEFRSTDLKQNKTYLLNQITCNEFFNHLKTYYKTHQLKKRH